MPASLPILLLLLLSGAASLYGQATTSAPTTAAQGGPCGPEVNAICPYGQCCSKDKWCGVTADHCSDTCLAAWSGQQCGSGSTSGTSSTQYSESPTPTPAANSARDAALAAGATVAQLGQQCGKAFNAVCPENQCCSTGGWCGVTQEHCVTNCDGAWGFCGSEYIQNGTPTVPGQASNSAATTAASGGQCGPGVNAKCNQECCSTDGYCGITPEHCGMKCVAEWGTCPNNTAPVPPPPAPVPEPHTVWDTKTIAGTASAVVVGVGATIGIAYTVWKWWHKRRGLAAAQAASQGSQALPPLSDTMGVPRVKDVAAAAGGFFNWAGPGSCRKSSKGTQDQTKDRKDDSDDVDCRVSNAV